MVNIIEHDNGYNFYNNKPYPSIAATVTVDSGKEYYVDSACVALSGKLSYETAVFPIVDGKISYDKVVYNKTYDTADDMYLGHADLLDSFAAGEQTFEDTSSDSL